MNTILERFGEHAVLNMLNGSPLPDGATKATIGSAMSPENLAQLSAAFHATNRPTSPAEQSLGGHAASVVYDLESEAEWSSRGTSPEPSIASFSALHFSPHSAMSLSMIREEEGDSPHCPADADQDAEDGVFLDLRTFMNCAPFAIRWKFQATVARH